MQKTQWLLTNIMLYVSKQPCPAEAYAERAVELYSIMDFKQTGNISSFKKMTNQKGACPPKNKKRLSSFV